MKKFIAVALILVTVLALFVACGSKEKFVCDICGEEKTGTKYEVSYNGETVKYCDDQSCKSQGDAAKLLVGLAEGLGG